MKGRFSAASTILLLVVTLLAGALPTGVWPSLAQTRISSPVGPGLAPSAVQITSALRASPLMFVENVGQFDPGARFQVSGGDRTIWVAGDGIWITVVEKPALTTGPMPQPGSEASAGQPPFADDIRGLDEPYWDLGEGISRRGVNLKLSFPEANPSPRLEPFDRLDTVVSYFIGNDPEKWRPAVPVWGGVRYRDLYPGIDLEVAGENGRLAQRLVAREGADLSPVRLRVEGAESLTLEGDHVLLSTAVGDFTLPLLEAVNPAGDPVPLSVEGPRVRQGEVSAPFAKPGPQNTPLPAGAGLSGDSDLLYSTFLGGSNGDSGRGIAVDDSGAAYVTGYTQSANFPTTDSAFDTTHNGGSYDAFVTRVSPTGSSLLYSTLLGGSSDDNGRDIAVDTSGAAYLTGITYSADFPTTSGAYDTSYNGGTAFVTKLGPSGSSLLYSTYLGGSSGDGGRGIAVDTNGSAYVTGYAYSSNFPATPGAYDTSHNGYSDAFVAKLNPSGSRSSLRHPSRRVER